MVPRFGFQLTTGRLRARAPGLHVALAGAAMWCAAAAALTALDQTQGTTLHTWGIDIDSQDAVIADE